MIPELEQRKREIEQTELSEDELKYAIWNAKCIKWQTLRNAEYWEALERRKHKDVSSNVGFS